MSVFLCPRLAFGSSSSRSLSILVALTEADIGRARPSRDDDDEAPAALMEDAGDRCVLALVGGRSGDVDESDVRLRGEKREEGVLAALPGRLRLGLLRPIGDAPLALADVGRPPLALNSFAACANLRCFSSNNCCRCLT